MASYHFSVKSKNKGYALGHYLYISRLMQYENIRSDRQEVLEHVELGRCMPSWVDDPIEFWQAADTFERANAKVYMEYEIALPNEFTPEQRKMLVETFSEKYIASQHYPHSYAIHSVKSRLSGEDQPHCHLMFSLKADDGLPRSAEQYFKRYNPKQPAQGGAKKVQLQQDHQDYSTFLLYIRKAWEDHLNDALAEHSPTIDYPLANGQTIQLVNRVSADSYEQYNAQYGTLYLPEPKLGVGQQNMNAEYLAEIQKIRLHNIKERELERKQQTLQPEYFYSCTEEAYSSLEVIRYVEHLLKSAVNQKQLIPDLQHIVNIYQPLFRAELLDHDQLNRRFRISQQQAKPCFDFQIDDSSYAVSKSETVSTSIQQSKPSPDLEIKKNVNRDRGYDYDPW